LLFSLLKKKKESLGKLSSEKESPALPLPSISQERQRANQERIHAPLSILAGRCKFRNYRGGGKKN
jgi:hypothetical protein